MMVCLRHGLDMMCDTSRCACLRVIVYPHFLSGACAPRSTTIILYSLLLIL